MRNLLASLLLPAVGVVFGGCGSSETQLCDHICDWNAQCIDGLDQGECLAECESDAQDDDELTDECMALLSDVYRCYADSNECDSDMMCLDEQAAFVAACGR